MVGATTIQWLGNRAVIVDDLDAVVAFLTEPGMELESKRQVDGPLRGPHRRTRRRLARHRDDADPRRPHAKLVLTRNG
jgi:hypothetical protein